MVRLLDFLIEKMLFLLFVIRSSFLVRKRKCLLISHEASLSGAPVVLLNVAKILCTLGWTPIILSPYRGPLFSEARQNKITMLRCHWRNIVRCAQFGAKRYDLIIVNTSVNGYVVNGLQDFDYCPVLWWIHESAAVYSDACIRQLPVEVKGHIKICAGGDYAKSQLRRFRPNYNIQTLLYPTLDLKKIISEEAVECSKKINLYCIGTIEERKGQDLLVRAIKQLPQDVLNECCFTFIGRIGSPEIYSTVKSLVSCKGVACESMGTVPLKDLYKQYQKMDVLICPSRDDPMPVVVADALSLGKIVVCSSNTGCASILTANNAGIVFQNNSVTDLTNSIIEAIRIVKQKRLRSIYSARARSAYKDNFSEDSFLKSFEILLRKLNL